MTRDANLPTLQKQKSTGWTKKEQRKAAKVGMIASMGILTLTGFVHSPYRKRTHTLAGLALLGFSYWHANLYKAKKQGV